MNISNRFRAAAIAAALVFLALSWSLERGQGLARWGSGWKGAWNIPESALYDLALDTEHPATWIIDGQPAVQVTFAADRAVPRTLWLESGFHPIEVRYQVRPTDPSFGLLASPSGKTLKPVSVESLKPNLPRNPRLRAMTVVVRAFLGWVIAVMAVVWFRKWLPPIQIPTFAHGRWLAWGILALVLIWGALLRLDALTVRYGVVSSPGWVAAVQTRTILPPLSIRHPWFPWVAAPLSPHEDGPPTRYISDPYTYLTAARGKTSFYSAHDREPVFPYAVKIALGIFKGQDVAVSFTSLGFSLAAVWLTYILGAAVWSRPAGVLAALAVSVDRDVITQSVLGWRDDAYVAAVALCAYLFIRYWRSGSVTPPRAAYLTAAALGLALGFAVLVRFMAFSFIAVAGGYVVWTMTSTPARRWRMAAIAFAAATLFALPYFVNCWRVFGDPLYTWNVHGSIYRAAEGKAATGGDTFSYITEKIGARPLTAIDTVARGMTTYPFGNKWEGLDSWYGGLGRASAILSLAGLVILAFSPSGRVLLVILLSSLAPFSFTWRVDPNWRFTEHVLPLLFIAAAVALVVAARLLWRILSRAGDLRSAFIDRDRGAFARPIPVRRVLAAVALIAIGCWYLARVSPHFVFAETLRAGEDLMITADDSAAFAAGWLPGVATGGNVRTRVSRDRGTLHFRLPEAIDYQMTLRIDPFPQPLPDAMTSLPDLHFVLNGDNVATVPMQWTPGRVGTYRILATRDRVRAGHNELIIRADGAAFALWHLRISRE